MHGVFSLDIGWIVQPRKFYQSLKSVGTRFNEIFQFKVIIKGHISGILAYKQYISTHNISSQGIFRFVMSLIFSSNTFLNQSIYLLLVLLKLTGAIHDEGG